MASPKGKEIKETAITRTLLSFLLLYDWPLERREDNGQSIKEKKEVLAPHFFFLFGPHPQHT
jgi:hypothetical protein